MYRAAFLILLVAVVSIARGNDMEQTSMVWPERIDLTTEDKLANMQRNVSALWTYIYELRGAVTHHLNHLRQHQVEMEEAIHRIEHHSDGHGDSHGSDHSSHSGEDHSHGSHHSGENHGHGSSSSGEHHHHSGEHHSHGGDDHHSHSGEHGHDSHSHSHSHTDDPGHGDHGHDHKDSHENSDDQSQVADGTDPLVEPVIVPSTRPSHNHHHHPHSHGSSSSGGSTFEPLNVGDGHHHHSHGSTSSMVRNRTRTVTMPKYSEYDLYELATCTIQANRAIPVEQQQNIVGQISLWQKKSGGPLNIHVRLSGFSMGDHAAGHTHAYQLEYDGAPMVHKHGFHVHTYANFSNSCQSTGPHYNPKGVNHGGPKALVRHVGDLGNIECDNQGVANLIFNDSVASLKGPYSILGKSMVIHSGQDDLGLGSNDESLKTGNAGVRIACCEIIKVDKLPIRAYRAMKTAIQHQN